MSVLSPTITVVPPNGNVYVRPSSTSASPVESKFKCPCHGSGFRMTGIHFEGPAPRPLERFKIGLATDGQILVDKTKSFKWEKGEWENPESFLKV